jgi:hypothetical protein
MKFFHYNHNWYPQHNSNSPMRLSHIIISHSRCAPNQMKSPPATSSQLPPFCHRRTVDVIVHRLSCSLACFFVSPAQAPPVASNSQNPRASSSHHAKSNCPNSSSASSKHTYFAETTFLTLLIPAAELATRSDPFTARKWYTMIRNIMRLPKKQAIKFSSLSVTIVAAAICLLFVRGCWRV